MMLGSCLLLLLSSLNAFAVVQEDTVYFNVGMEQRSNHTFHVTMRTEVSGTQDYVDLRMPVWSPGYYQLMDFPDRVNTFEATDSHGATLDWERLGKDTWRVRIGESREINVGYSVLADRPFVATSYVDTGRAFIKPASLFMYPDGQLEQPVILSVNPPEHWPDVATGLEPLPGVPFAYVASDFDMLYDSPLLIGALKVLPTFFVDSIEHRFIGYGMETFDEESLMTDIQKIVESSVALIGELPYRHYTFIGLGPGQGGIEQLNSTAISFTGKGLDGPGRLNILSFITHEYFHHYNVKRIRPIELGPFDYSQPNRTNLLWVAEGLTVYYENVVLSRAGLMSGQEILEDWTNIINRHENNEGRFKQTLAESSWNTWEDGPFGKPGETISYYVKGPIIGMLLDIEIRHATGNKRSLDDVMRTLYYNYYKQAGRGFTEEEMKAVCEDVAGKALDDIFRYIYTLDEVDYEQYFRKAGLEVRPMESVDEKGTIKRQLTIQFADKPDELQQAIRMGIFGL